MVYGLLETVSKFKKNAEFLKSEHFVLELRGCAFLTEPPFRASNCKQPIREILVKKIMEIYNFLKLVILHKNKQLFFF